MPEPTPLSHQVLVHFYRAVVSHADAWRQRMDATTNWAAATTAAMISVSFGAGSPHFILLLSLTFDTMFLLMESRRYQVYDLWRRRVHWMNRYFILPALSEKHAPSAELTREAMDDLALDLGRTLPRIPLRHAIGYRVQRNYGYLFGVALVAWILKLQIHPRTVAELGELIGRARVGHVPGSTVWGIVLVFVLGITMLALQAPSEGMVEWTETPSRWNRWRDRRRRGARGPQPDGKLPHTPMDA